MVVWGELMPCGRVAVLCRPVVERRKSSIFSSFGELGQRCRLQWWQST
jgi:hypothetical protein